MGPGPCHSDQNAQILWKERLALILVMAAALWMYRGAFRSSFIQDDFGWLVLSRFHSFVEWAGCFFRFNAAGTYRPLSQETYFWIGQRLFGLWAPGYHVFSIAAHLTAVWLVYRLARYFSGPLGALTGAFFYAVHSAHVTSLYWISAFPEPLAVVFLLASVISFIRFERTNSRTAYALSLAAMLFGVFSKESILCLPLVLAAYCLLWARPRVVWTYPHFAVAGICVLMRLLGSVRWAPYDLSLGRNTPDTLASYLSWMAGFSGTVVQNGFGWPLPGSYRWIAAAFVVATLLLIVVARKRRASIWALLWILFALQPVLYFADHSFPYYLAPALAGFSLLLASVFAPSSKIVGWKKWAPAVLTGAAIFWLSYLTVKPEGDWWAQRTLERREFIDRLLEIHRRVPENAAAYIFGLSEQEFEKLENGGVFKVYNLPARKFRFLLPELDPDLPLLLRRLKNDGDGRRAYSFLFSAGKVIDQTETFRSDPERFLPPKPVSFQTIPGVALDVGPAEIVRGRDTLSLRLVNLDARAVDVLYALDGQLMPPVLQWRLDAGHSASVFADMSTPAGAYDFRAVRPSGSSRWIRIDARIVVR